ncbi:MAG: hypothetical protein IOD12_06935 [Silvanigrellales bacterium]|nr:hypothetical protein [Silvanigrellales bacterium]
MRPLRTFPLALTLTLASLASLAACKTRTYNSQADSTKGVPEGLTATYESDPTRPDVMKFEIIAINSRGQQTSVVTRYALGGAGFSDLQFLRDPDKKLDPSSSQTSGNGTNTDSNLFGSLLTQIQDEKYGYVSNTPWTCRDAEAFVYDSQKGDPNQLCLIEMHTMGRPGSVSVILIPLDLRTAGNGVLDEKVVKEAIARKLRVDPAWGAAKIAVSVGVKTRPIANGHPERTNEGIDVNGAATAIYDVYEKYKDVVDDLTRNTCLRNYSSVLTKWTDVAEHYWCQFPLEALPSEDSSKQGARTCYITKLLELKGADDGAGLSITRPELPKLAAAIGLRQYHDAAYEHCVAQGEGPFVWIDSDPNRKAAFKYIMQAVQLAQDFNLESEQKAVNEFYRRIAKPRARRVNDTYPVWLPEQPRYAEIIKFQALTRLGFDLLLKRPYDQWLKTNPTGPGVPGRFASAKASGSNAESAAPKSSTRE